MSHSLTSFADQLQQSKHFALIALISEIGVSSVFRSGLDTLVSVLLIKNSLLSVVALSFSNTGIVGLLLNPSFFSQPQLQHCQHIPGSMCRNIIDRPMPSFRAACAMTPPEACSAAMTCASVWRGLRVLSFGICDLSFRIWF